MIKEYGRTLLLIISLLLVLFLSCSNESGSQQTKPAVSIPADGIEIRNAWARPGRENGTSAIYMDVLNGSQETDSLISLSSPVSGMVEIHESYENGHGMMAMRHATDIVFPAKNVVSMEPGGLHIMLMQLNTKLTEGEEVELTIQFAKAGEVHVTAPVRTMR